MNNENVFLVYECDAHHTIRSFVLIGVSFEWGGAISLLHQYIEKCKDQERYPPLTKNDLFHLNQMGQTQYYGGHGEWVITKVKANKVLFDRIEK